MLIDDSSRLSYLLLEHFNVVFEALESYKHDGEIVERAMSCRSMKNFVGYLACNRVYRWDLLQAVGLKTRLGRDIPYNLIDLVVC